MGDVHEYMDRQCRQRSPLSAVKSVVRGQLYQQQRRGLPSAHGWPRVLTAWIRCKSVAWRAKAASEGSAATGRAAAVPAAAALGKIR